MSDRMAAKGFAYVHQHNLVYNTCWEDPRLDRQAMRLGPQDDVLVITSAGCNALDYVLAGARRVYAVDLNFRQNALLELKLAALRRLDYESVFEIFGRGRSSRMREMDTVVGMTRPLRARKLVSPLQRPLSSSDCAIARLVSSRPTLR